MPAASCWRLDGAQAEGDTGSVSLAVDLATPDSGARRLQFFGRPQPGVLWRWGIRDAGPPTLSESYVRGADVIAEYSTTDDPPLDTQLYWQCDQRFAQAAAVLNLTISVRTPALDTHPVYWVESQLPVTNVSRITCERGQFLGVHYAAESGDWSAVEAIQPGDLTSRDGPTIEPQGEQTRCHWRLVDQFLEKGVIRRARLSLAVTDHALTPAEAHALAARLREQPAPLTA